MLQLKFSQLTNGYDMKACLYKSEWMIWGWTLDSEAKLP